MFARTGFALVCASLISSAAFGQQCVENICFIDRGATGEISLGPRFGSVACIDFDNDGYQDLIVRDRLEILVRLYHNQPDPVRVGERTFVDITESTVFAQFTGAAATPEGALVADFDNDGWSDVYLSGRRTSEAVSGRLYRNNGGVFVDVTATSGIEATGDDPESASWVDFDLDGYVDLFVASRAGGANPIRLMKNQGDGTFVDVSHVLPTFAGASRMYASTWTDIDGDGYPDMLGIPTTGPMLLHNVSDGAGGRMFVEAAASRGFDLLGPAPMGISTGDYDNDGDFDIGISNGATGVYYENQSGMLVRRALMESIWAWGVLWLDVNNDGLLDHYQSGSAGRSLNFNKLFINRGNGMFEDISAALNDLFVSSQHALQMDFNNDGRQDIITINPFNSPTFVSVSENVSTTGNHWFRVQVKGDRERVNGDAIGAVVRVTAGGVQFSREVTSGSSTNSTDDLRAHFGVGAATVIDRIEVLWPRGGSIAARTEVYEGPMTVDQTVVIRPRCAADTNADGAVNSEDFFEFVLRFLNQDDRADADGNGVVDSADFFAFLGVFFVGC